MNTDLVKKQIARFVDAQDTDEFIVRHSGVHRTRRTNAMHLLQPDALKRMSPNDFMEFLSQTDADYGRRMGNDQKRREIFGQDDEHLPEVREVLLALLEQAERGLTAEEFTRFINSLGGIGPAYLSEMLALRFPNQYWLWNRAVREFLEKHEVQIKQDLPYGKKTDPGAEYMAAGRYVTQVRQLLSELTGRPVDYLFTDLFMFWTVQQGDFAPPQEPVEPAGPRVFTGFVPDTFQFLQELEKNNTKEWMDQNRTRYETNLRDRLYSLFEQIGPQMRNLDPSLETDARFGKVMAGIVRRHQEDAVYYPYLWGAFYQQGGKKQTETQLYVIVHPTHINAGLAVAGARDSGRREQFLHNLEIAPALFVNLTTELPDDVNVMVTRSGMVPEAIRVDSAAALQQLSTYDSIEFVRSYDMDDPVIQSPQFADHIFRLFQILHPLYQFIIADSPEALEAIREQQEEVPYALGEQPLYTMEDLVRDTYLERRFWQTVEELLLHKPQLILYGPPGTGKTWVAQRLARYWIDDAKDPAGDVQIVQFHPSYAYEDFIEGIRPGSVDGPDGTKHLTYAVKPGIFKDLCDTARRYPDRRYVLIIDEINRGELPRIFGELLFLLEYRQDRTVRLPYSNTPFAIPRNLYLIGTMNTADRSIALVDHALRRRFHFVRMEPDPNILRQYYEGDDMIWAAHLLEEVNAQLERDGIDWHLHIGHSHFMVKGLTREWVQAIWENSIMPVLEEYFYRQPERLEEYRLAALLERLGV